MPITKNCPQCGRNFKDKPSAMVHRVYCCKACMSKAFKIRLRGAANPHFTGGGLRGPCKTCGEMFKSYNSFKQFCSKGCYDRSRRTPEARAANSARVKAFAAANPKPGPHGCRCVCALCSKDFRWEWPRKYCTDCSETGVRLNSRADINQSRIVEALRSVGASVWVTSSIGKGSPDLVAAFEGVNHLIEVKSDSRYGKAGLSEEQSKFHANWRGPIHLVRSPEEALAAIGIKLRAVEAKHE